MRPRRLKEKVEKEIKLLEKKKELNEREAPIREKNQRVEEELKRLRKVSQAFGNELPAAPQAQSASAHRQKVPKFALSLGWARVELSARTRRKVKLTVPKANRGLLTLLRHTQIRTLPLTVRITVIRSGETKTTSKRRDRHVQAEKEVAASRCPQGTNAWRRHPWVRGPSRGP